MLMEPRSSHQLMPLPTRTSRQLRPLFPALNIINRRRHTTPGLSATRPRRNHSSTHRAVLAIPPRWKRPPRWLQIMARLSSLREPPLGSPTLTASSHSQLICLPTITPICSLQRNYLSGLSTAAQHPHLLMARPAQFPSVRRQQCTASTLQHQATTTRMGIHTN